MRRPGLIVALAAGLSIGAAFPAHAKLTLTRPARYDTKDGPSNWYTVKITFMTGDEMQTATDRWGRYNYFTRYAVIFWGPGQATVIDLGGGGFCGPTFDSMCFIGIEGMARSESGEDQEGRTWHICIEPNFAGQC